MCEGTADACTWTKGISGRISFVSKGVTMYTSVSNGVGVAAGASTGGGSGGGSKPNAAGMVSASYAGMLAASLLGLVAQAAL